LNRLAPLDLRSRFPLGSLTASAAKSENLAHAVSLHFTHYNFARPHRTLKDKYPRTPAMAAGVADHIWSLEEIAALLD
jgi:hypothetical protein